jgi:hypothetical protein
MLGNRTGRTHVPCSSALLSARQKSVLAYPKQRATVLVASVLKWRARPQCLRRQKSVFSYPKQRATLSVGSVLKWRARPQCLRRQKSFFSYTKQRATLSVGSALKWRARPQCLRRRRDFVLQMNNTKATSWKTLAHVNFMSPKVGKVDPVQRHWGGRRSQQHKKVKAFQQCTSDGWSKEQKVPKILKKIPKIWIQNDPKQDWKSIQILPARVNQSVSSLGQNWESQICTRAALHKVTTRVKKTLTRLKILD